MEIKTKFDIGQEVYYIDEFKNASGKVIYEINTDIISEIIIRKNNVGYGTANQMYELNEVELFATYEEAEKELSNIHIKNC